MSFSKVLVANRGEIAARVIRSARALGYRTVAIYSEADHQAPHVALADEAVCIGPAPAAQSYLSIAAVIGAARATGADAVHPGYGFLSENAAFARACAEANIVFIGPPAAAIELMGSKRLAKTRMIEAGVPCVPGYEGDDTSDAALLRAAETISFPLMVKASAGGGGRGMRLVQAGDDLREALRSARAEAESAFGSGELILEKAVMKPRHVEIQIFGDAHGGVIHLGERDCSVQRRHQKVIEECPSPAVTPELRERMGAAAIAAAKACDYVGAGTVEFLLDEDGAFYFLEMNTRLQVEHPVTEMVTGIDLIAWQLRVAAGERLPLQSEIRFRGHAIEARLYAEDPRQGYLPQTGAVLAWEPAEGEGLRIDHGVGSTVSSHYDPMVAKIIAHGASREEARRRLLGALRDTVVFGVVTNAPFLAAVLADEAFARGEATTALLAERFADHPAMRLEPPSDRALALAALVLTLHHARAVVPDETFVSWRSGGPLWSTLVLACDGRQADVHVIGRGRGDHGQRFALRVADDPIAAPAIELEVVADTASKRVQRLVVISEGVRTTCRYLVAGDTLWLDDGTGARAFVDVTHRPARSEEEVGSGRLTAPLDGAVTSVFVAEGEVVAKGKVLLVIEAMKMEHRIVADVDGTVRALHVKPGDQARARQLLVELTAEGAA